MNIFIIVRPFATFPRERDKNVDNFTVGWIVADIKSERYHDTTFSKVYNTTTVSKNLHVTFSRL